MTAATAIAPSELRSQIAVRRGIWIAVAALAMAATLPGRTHGLGLITEPLLADLRIDRVDYGHINLWATLIGAFFCLPCGWLIDRFGIRPLLVVIVLALGTIVVLMSQVAAAPVPIIFFLLVLLTRGLGQSALSVVSLTLIGRSAGRDGSGAMAVYSVLVTLGFMAAFGLVKVAIEQWLADWRTLWMGIGIVLLVGVAPIGAFVLPRWTESSTLETSEERQGVILATALRTPAFWVFAGATSLYGLIASGVSLFNQSILAERHFDRSIFLNITIISPFVGLAGNLLTGWLARRYGMDRLLAVAMLVLAAALLAFPLVTTETEVYLYAVTLGFAGGMVTVIFFGVWVRLYGTAHLGRIQGAAQMMTVCASAVGPLLLALSKEQTGSYLPLFRILAAGSALLAVASWRLKLNPSAGVA